MLAWFRRGWSCPVGREPCRGSAPAARLEGLAPEVSIGFILGVPQPAAAACPPRPILRLHHYLSSSQQTAPRRKSLAKHPGDAGAVRTRAPGAPLHGREGGQHPRALRGNEASATSGPPQDSLLASGDGLGAEAGRHRHPARQALPRLPEAPATPVRAATSLAFADYVSLVGFFALGGCVGRLPPPTEGAPSRKQKGAAGINVYSKASLVQALHPEVGRRAGGGSFRP